MKSTLNPDFNRKKNATDCSTSAANFNTFGEPNAQLNKCKAEINANLYLRHSLVHTSW